LWNCFKEHPQPVERSSSESNKPWIIFEANQYADNLFFVGKGKIDLYDDKGELVSKLHKGSFFGK
jgi:hypothetical protein